MTTVKKVDSGFNVKKTRLGNFCQKQRLLIPKLESYALKSQKKDCGFDFERKQNCVHVFYWDFLFRPLLSFIFIMKRGIKWKISIIASNKKITMSKKLPHPLRSKTILALDIDCGSFRGPDIRSIYKIQHFPWSMLIFGQKSCFFWTQQKPNNSTEVTTYYKKIFIKEQANFCYKLSWVIDM